MVYFVDKLNIDLLGDKQLKTKVFENLESVEKYIEGKDCVKCIDERYLSYSITELLKIEEYMNHPMGEFTDKDVIIVVSHDVKYQGQYLKFTKIETMCNWKVWYKNKNNETVDTAISKEKMTMDDCLNNLFRPEYFDMELFPL